MTLAHLLSLAWSHHEQAVAAGAAFLVAYFSAPDALRARTEARFPRWRATVGLLRDVLPFLPGVPAHVKAIVAGASDLPVRVVVVVPPSVGPLAPPHDDPDDEDAHPSMLPPEPVAPVLRAATVTGRETIAPTSQADYEIARRGVHAEGLFDAGARQLTVTPSTDPKEPT